MDLFYSAAPTIMSTPAISNGIRSFFLGIGELISRGRLRESLDSVIFVTGNESAGMFLLFQLMQHLIYLDMDSCASSIITAYLLSIEIGLTDNKAKGTSGSPSLVLPLLNIPRQDLNLRLDIKHLLNYVGISPKSLPFMDDLTSLSASELKDSKAFLVDHNKLVGISEMIFGNRVVGIIDHHDDEGFYETEIKSAQGPRIIQKTGSCSSLVVKHFSTVLGSSVFKKDRDLAFLALGPLLADTSAMKSSKVEDPDREVYKLYKESLDMNDKQVEDLYKTLDDLKRDVSTLTGPEFLRKDYKEWTPENQEASGKIGISSMVKPLNYLFDTYPHFLDDMKAWGHSRSLDVLILNCSYSDKEDGKFKRDLLIFSPSGVLSEKLVDVIEKITAELKLSPLLLDNKAVAVGSDIHMFHQGNTKASRKQLAPLFKYHIQGVPLNSL